VLMLLREPALQVLGSAGCRVARASRVLAIGSLPSRTFLVLLNRFCDFPVQKSLFRRDAETDTRDACATQAEEILGRRDELSR
jgi:hypothetical protein